MELFAGTLMNFDEFVQHSIQSFAMNCKSTNNYKKATNKQKKVPEHINK